jgi:hypothetical protein
MAYTYRKNIEGREKLFTDTVQRIARVTGIRFSGDESGGRFSGRTVVGEISGFYAAANGVITITVSKKPFMVSEAKLTAAFDKFFD